MSLKKACLKPQNSTGGRNCQGRRAMRYMGGGHKKIYRIIDFKRNKKDIPATVRTIEYDPNRTAFIALLNMQMVKKDTSLLHRVYRLVQQL